MKFQHKRGCAVCGGSALPPRTSVFRLCQEHLLKLYKYVHAPTSDGTPWIESFPARARLMRARYAAAQRLCGQRVPS
jgi:hypothetical protein